MSDEPYVKLIPREPGLFTERRIGLKEKASIGRAVGKVKPMNTNGIFDSKVLSRAHAEIWFEDGKFMMKDVKSSNGTFLNNSRLSETSQESKNFEIHNEDIVQFGVDVLENNKVAHKCIIATLVVCNPADPDSVAAAAAAEANAAAAAGDNADYDDDAPIVSSGSSSSSASNTSTANVSSNYMAALSALGIGGGGGSSSSSSSSSSSASSSAPAAPASNATDKGDGLARSQTIILDGANASQLANAIASNSNSINSASSKTNSLATNDLPAALEAAGGDVAAIAAMLSTSTMGSMNAATAAAVAAAVAAAQAPKAGIVQVRDETILKLTEQLASAYSHQLLLNKKLAQLESIIISLEEAAAEEYETYFEEEKLISRIQSLENQVAFYQSKITHTLQALGQDSSDSDSVQKIAELMASFIKTEEDHHLFEMNSKDTIRKTMQEMEEQTRRATGLERLLTMTNGTFAELRQELQESKAKAQQLRIDNDRLTVTIEQNEQQMSSLKTEIEELRLSNSGVSDLKRKLAEQSEQLEKAEKFRNEFMAMQEQWVTQDNKRQDEIQSLRKSVTEITSDRDILKQQVSSLRVTLATALQPSSEAENAKSKVAELEKVAAALTSNVATLTAKNTEGEQTVKELQSSVSELSAKLAQVEAEKAELETVNKSLRESANSKQSASFEEAAALSEATAQNSELVKKCDKLVQEITALRSERDKLATELHETENDKSQEALKLHEDIVNKELELEKLQTHSESIAQDLALARAKLEKKEASTREELASLGARLGSITKERDELSDSLSELRKTLNAKSPPLLLTSASVIVLAALVAWRQMQ